MYLHLEQYPETYFERKTKMLSKIFFLEFNVNGSQLIIYSAVNVKLVVSPVVNITVKKYK